VLVGYVARVVLGKRSRRDFFFKGASVLRTWRVSLAGEGDGVRVQVGGPVWQLEDREEEKTRPAHHAPQIGME